MGFRGPQADGSLLVSDQFLDGWLQGLGGGLGWCWPSGRRGQVSERLAAWPGDFGTVAGPLML